MSGDYEVERPDADGDFLLADGNRGNPGCDECGAADAVIKVDGRYLCGGDDERPTAATEREVLDQHLAMFLEADFTTVEFDRIFERLLESLPPAPDPTNPNLTDGLRSFFAVEIRNIEQMRRGEGLDPATGTDPDDYDEDDEDYQPEVVIADATLYTALDSWRQAPDGVLLAWLDIADSDATQVAQLHIELARLAELICQYGPGARLTDFLED